MDTQKTLAWVKSALISCAGGGIAGAFAAAMDPTKYNLAHDIGSGKLWKYFGMGALLTFGGMLLRSPLGQSAMQAYKDSQAQAKEDAAMLDKVKQDILTGSKAEPPPPGKPQL